jgi:undecaprenyl diphosphate synthase
MSLVKEINKSQLPQHIAIIMDGNGRWALRHGKDRIFGHHQGVESVRVVIETAAELGINYLTLYAFSTENWERPDEEVAALMGLMVQSLNDETDTLLKNNIKLSAIGDIDRLDEDVKKRLFETIQVTSVSTGLNLVVALSYSSRWEIIKAVKQIAGEVANGRLEINSIDQSLFDHYLSTKEIPDPDLLIRTSGELRISNFLLCNWLTVSCILQKYFGLILVRKIFIRQLFNFRKEKDGLAKQANRYLRKSVMMERNHFKKIIAGLLTIVTCIPLFSQEKTEILDYSKSDIYVLGGITISGIRFLDLNALVGLSGLKEGQEMRIPGETVSNAAKKLGTRVCSPMSG